MPHAPAGRGRRVDARPVVRSGCTHVERSRTRADDPNLDSSSRSFVAAAARPASPRRAAEGVQPRYGEDGYWRGFEQPNRPRARRIMAQSSASTRSGAPHAGCVDEPWPPRDRVPEGLSWALSFTVATTVPSSCHARRTEPQRAHLAPGPRPVSEGSTAPASQLNHIHKGFHRRAGNRRPLARDLVRRSSCIDSSSESAVSMPRGPARDPGPLLLLDELGRRRALAHCARRSGPEASLGRVSLLRPRQQCSGDCGAALRASKQQRDAPSAAR